MKNRAITIAVVIFVVMGIALILAARAGQTPHIKGNRGLFFSIATIMLVAFVIVIILGVRASRHGARQWREKADTLGDSIDLDFDHDPPKHFHRDFTFLPEIKKSGKTNHLAHGSIAGRTAVFFEHSYVVSTGQHTTTVFHCVYTTQAPDWPRLSITPRGPFSKLFRKLGRRKGLLLDDPNFNHAFIVRCDDEPFAVTLLTPGMQRFMLEKTNVRWRITHEKIFLIYKGALKLKRMPVSVDRLARFWSNVPPEVETWEPHSVE